MTADEPEDLSDKYPPIMVNQTALGHYVGLTTRWIYTLEKEGIFRKVDGKYDLMASAHAYYAYKIKKEAETRAPSASESLASRKEEILKRRMQREDREIIDLDDALDTVDLVTGAFNTALSGLPARITREIQERKRIEAICDGVRTSLEKAFGEQREALRTGKPVGEAGEAPVS